jgi:hypothetical protein
MLQDPVRRALGTDAAEVRDWDVRPLGNVHNEVTGGLYRIRGTASTEGTPVAWSLVLKMCRDPGADHFHDNRAANFWKREFLAYSSGLLANLPPGVRAPHCYGAEEGANGSAWLWLEDLTDSYGASWPLERYALAARHAGQFNGAYLAGRPIPDLPWLSVGGGTWPFELLGPQLERVHSLRDHPLIRREWPDPAVLDRSIRLWREREVFYGALARLPRALCHLDFFRLNLFAVRAPNGADETVGVDWAFVGTAAVGEELAQLVAASVVHAGDYADRVRDLGEVCFAGYLEGLREVGWSGDARLARLGYAAGMIRFGGTWTPLLLNNSAEIAAVERAWGPYGEFVDRWATVRRFLLDLADEARLLMVELW